MRGSSSLNYRNNILIFYASRNRSVGKIPELLIECKEYLKTQGYFVNDDVKLLGKSGIHHTFDMVAEKNDGISNYSVCICFNQENNPESEANIIYSFANKAFDTGIKNRLLISLPTLNNKLKHFATGQRITVVDGDTIGSFLSKPTIPIKPTAPVSLETPSSFVESLKLRGYTVVEKGIIRGRSGLNYTFDVVARGEGDQVNHTIVMDYLFSPNEVGIDRVLAFDAKAHDANTDEKIVVVFSGLSTEARKFTQYQHIKVLYYHSGTEPKSGVSLPEREMAEPDIHKRKSGKTGDIYFQGRHESCSEKVTPSDKTRSCADDP